MRLDAAGEVELIAGEMRLGRSDHGIDFIVPAAMAHAIEVGAILGPGFRY